MNTLEHCRQGVFMISLWWWKGVEVGRQLRASLSSTNLELWPSTMVGKAPSWAISPIVRERLSVSMIVLIAPDTSSAADHYLTRHSAADLKPFHKLCLDRPGNVSLFTTWWL